MSDHLSRRDSAGGPLSRPCGLPGPRRAGSSVLLGLAPGGVCLAAASPRRRCALTAPFHLCLYAAHVWPRHRPCVSVALSRGFPRVGVTHRPCPVVSGLSSRGFLSPRDRSARSVNGTARTARRLRAALARATWPGCGSAQLSSEPQPGSRCRSAAGRGRRGIRQGRRPPGPPRRRGRRPRASNPTARTASVPNVPVCLAR